MDQLAVKQTGKESTNDVLTNYYRCPSGSTETSAAQPAEMPPGYFRWGSNVTCYGRLNGGNVAHSPLGELPDVLSFRSLDSQGIDLPFNAEEVIENLRRERYTAKLRNEGRIINTLVRKAYYFARPLMGVTVRRPLQRLFLRGWDKIPFPSWPLDTSVDQLHRKLLALLLRHQNQERIPFVWFWPDGYSSCAILTHDVEEEAGRDFCARLMDLDESYGFRSSFQLVPEDRYAVSRSFRESITARGFEVNVHDLTHDGRLFVDHAEFLRRVQRINSYVQEYGAEGFRSGALYRNAEWFTAFDFSYDMSFPRAFLI